MKKTLSFSTVIEAPRARVWARMIERESYRDWTTEFMPGSDYVGSWDAGASIRFVGPDGSGMSARIAENRLHEFISIEHLGMLDKGREDTTSEAARAWAPAYENYRFIELGPARTELRVDIDVTPDFIDYMNRTWPKALARLKAICETP